MFVRRYLSPLVDSFTPVLLLWVLVLLFIAIEEVLAESLKESDFADKPAHHVWFAMRSFALPNYWIWYTKEAVHEAIEAQGIDLSPFLLTTAFNASMFTPSLFVSTVATLLFLVNKRIANATHWVNSLIFWIPFLTFLCDLLEDFLMLVIALGYPYYQYPTMMQLLTWMSFLKFIGWIACGGLAGGILLMKNTMVGNKNSIIGGGERLHR